MFWDVSLDLLKGFKISLLIFILTLLGSLPLGLVIAFASMSKNKVVRGLSRAVVWIVRGSPLMLQLLIIYYGPGILLGNNIWGSGSTGRFTAVVLAFIFNYACYLSEIYRGGIESIPQSQYEAGLVLGLSRRQIFFKVVLLQVVKRIIPAIGNEVINLVKDTSLARVISVYELMWNGQAYIKRAGIIWPLFATGVFYLAFSGLMVILFDRLEKRLSYFK